MPDASTVTAQPQQVKRVPGKPFVKGDPRRYVGGTPKVGLIVREICRKELARKISTSDGKMPALTAIIRKGIIEAIKGDHKWAEFVVEHGYGKPTQAVELSGPDAGPVEINIPALIAARLEANRGK